MHKIIWRYCAKSIEPYTKKFYGVLPARVKFLIDIYKIPEESTELLVMGADDEKVLLASKESAKINIRKKFNIHQEDFLIVTGGKIDHSKLQVLNLIKIVSHLNIKKVKLLVFGSVASEIEEEFNTLIKNESIEYVGWINNEESYKLFSTADLVVFPGRHSVYWEQVVALGTPLVVKYWEGTTHVDIGGNCKFLYDNSNSELQEVLLEIISNKSVYKEMYEAANNEQKNQFLYSEIAKQSLS